MTNITKAAQDALAELADWHWSQAATLRKAASTSAMDKPEPAQSSLTRMADWHDAQKSIIRAALQDKAVEVPADGWLQDGGLLYRLTDDVRVPENRDEINVTMADGSRSPESRARRAGELLDRIRAAQPAPVAPDGFAIVPVDPTQAMIVAAQCAYWPGMEVPNVHCITRALKAAMIAASQQKGGQ